MSSRPLVPTALRHDEAQWPVMAHLSESGYASIWLDPGGCSKRRCGATGTSGTTCSSPGQSDTSDTSHSARRPTCRQASVPRELARLPAARRAIRDRRRAAGHLGAERGRGAGRAGCGAGRSCARVVGLHVGAAASLRPGDREWIPGRRATPDRASKRRSAWQRGQAMGIHQAVTHALAKPGTRPGRPDDPA